MSCALLSRANALKAIAISLLVITSVARGAPATVSATTTAALEPLVGGALRYKAPEGWTLVGDKADRLVRYKLSDDTGFLEIAVDLLPGAVRKSAAQQMALQ